MATTTSPQAQRTAVSPREPLLTGRLVQRGEPLPNVVLRLYTIVDHRPTATDQTVTTGADGTFASTGLNTNFWLRAEAASVPSDWQTSTQAPLTVARDLGDVEPPAALALDLLVVDATGQPIAAPRCWTSRSQIEVGLDPRDVRAPRPWIGETNGRVRLHRLHPGPLYLKVTADSFAMVQRVVELDATTAAPLPVILTPGSRVLGRVFDWSGKPLPGALASAEGRQVVTDATGAFVFANHGGVESIHIEAKSHKPWWPRPGQTDFTHIQLERMVALHGVVRGGNDATSIVLAGAPNVPDGVPWPGPNELLARRLPVAADGTFAIDGLEPSDFVVHARAEGLGASLGQRVAVRGDAEVELTIDPTAAIALRVVDVDGQPVAPVEVVCSLAIGEYPSLFGPHGTDICKRVFEGPGRLDIPALGNEARVPAPRDEALALGVRSPGYLPVVRTFAAGEAPPELTLELRRSGAVRGVVRGDSGPVCLRQVSLWPTQPDALASPPQASILRLQIDAQGSFHCEGLEPGEYRAAIYHYGRARIGKRPDEQVGAVPLIDEDEDQRTAIAFTATAGTTTDITLEELPFGTLRGRVLQGGRAVAGACVVAARPGATLWAGFMGAGETIDWDNEIDLQYVAGQRSGADGGFTFLYRTAGPVELRIRHAAGAATMPPVVVDLPAAGADVYHDLQIALGSIRGRFVATGTAGLGGRARSAVLFPLAKAATNPFLMSDWAASLAWTCKRCDLDPAGNFGFDHVPDGEWLVRVTNGFQPVYAQRLVVVRGDETDVGELREPASVTAKLAWNWPQGTPPRHVFGVWLHEEHAGAPAIWAGSHPANAEGAQCVRVVPGKYLVTVLGTLGEDPGTLVYGALNDCNPLSKPFALEVRSDGSTVPASVVLEPAAVSGK